MNTNRKLSFLSKIHKNGCWLWTAGRSGAGYGMFNVGGKMEYAHRISYEIYKGKIPKDSVIDHLCRVRSCVNPEHLETVSRGENVLRGEGPSAQHKRKTKCIHGHQYTPKNTYIRKDGNGKMCRKCLRIKYLKKVGKYEDVSRVKR